MVLEMVANEFSSSFEDVGGGGNVES